MYTIEGEWSGYTSAQRHVVHREHTRSKKRVEAVRKLGRIHYEDCTRLDLTVIPGKHGKPIDGYTALIDKCLALGISNVSDLPSEA